MLFSKSEIEYAFFSLYKKYNFITDTNHNIYKTKKIWNVVKKKKKGKFIFKKSFLLRSRRKSKTNTNILGIINM